MKIIRTVKELEAVTREARDKGLSVGFVPTMGALHKGHLSLVEKAVADNDMTVVSVFVNPTQFNDPEDLKKYPRTEEADAALLEEAGVDYAFIPSVEEVYPEEDTRVFDLGPVAEVMEGAMRPGHFNGVAQVVSRLFGWAHPSRAYFGEKDFQQIAVIRRMTELEGFDMEIVDCPISREDDGLARSSRNVRLSAEQRLSAPHIYRTLHRSLALKEKGKTPEEVMAYVVEEIDKNPHLKTEYYTIVDSSTLQPVKDWNDVAENAYPIGCAAVYCGDVRLIDNIKYRI